MYNAFGEYSINIETCVRGFSSALPLPANYCSNAENVLYGHCVSIHNMGVYIILVLSCHIPIGYRINTEDPVQLPVYRESLYEKKTYRIHMSIVLFQSHLLL